ncbi:MAG: hypothetical protein WBP16_10730 [Ferruginibacter sp.]
MKKLSFSFFISIFLLSCQFNSVKAQLLIGKLNNSVPVLTANKTTLISNFSKNLLGLSGINGNFTDVMIVPDGSNYYLVFKGSQFRSSMLLKTVPATDDNSTTNFYEDGGHVTCTTSDCASEPTGCVPSPVGLSCTPCANKGKCTKTVSSFSMLQ